MRPYFIGIGAQKAATSWLHLLLSQHPKVWMPPMKELHFFNRANNHSHFRTILFDKNNINSKNRFRYSDKKINTWNYRYFFNKRDFNYYQSLFLPAEGQICGEITPSYCTLESNKIKAIKDKFPSLKIIYIFRNPIERDWSQLCMTLKNHFKKDISKLHTNEILQYLKPKYLYQSDYCSNSERWEQHFKQEQLFYGFYDEIVENPKAFLRKLFQFLSLEISQMPSFQHLLEKKVNSFSTRIPSSVAKEIAKREMNNIKSTYAKFENEYTVRWLKQAENLINP